jgi:hypothetical protein
MSDPTLDEIERKATAVVGALLDRIETAPWLSPIGSTSALESAGVTVVVVGEQAVKRQSRSRSLHEQFTAAVAKNTELQRANGFQGGSPQEERMFRPYHREFLRSLHVDRALRIAERSDLGELLNLDLVNVAKEAIYAEFCPQTDYFRTRLAVYEAGYFPGLHAVGDTKRMHVF